MNVPQLSIGDKVYWTSSNKTKNGKVLAIVQPKQLPDLSRRGPYGPTHTIRTFGGIRPRDHVSYLIESREGLKLERAKPMLYWPVASLLRPAGTTFP